MISNYHGHTKHCKHGIGTTEQHILAAIDAGLQEVAITEHVPIKGQTLSRIDYEDFESFITELNDLKVKYQSKIKVLTGLECEYIPEIFDQHLTLQTKYKIDFLVLGQHFSNLSQKGNHFFITTSNEMIDDYISSAIEGIRSGHFKIFAHPDLFLNKLSFSDYAREKTIELLKVCEECQIAIEINANGVRNNKGYPNKHFWQIAKNYNVPIIINSDSHAPSEIYDEGVKNAYQFAQQLNIKITERLDFS